MTRADAACGERTSVKRHSAWVLSRRLPDGRGFAQGAGRDQLARGQALWDQRLANSAIAALEAAARDATTAAAAHEALGRIYTFKGWQQENVFPGMARRAGVAGTALAELKAAVAADPARASAQEALRTAEAFAAADKVDPAPPRPEIRALDAKLQAPAADASRDSRRRSTHGPKAQADPAPFFTGAQILIDRGEYDRAMAMAERGSRVRSVHRRNLSAYQMTGKSQAPRRGAARRPRI